MVASIHEHCQPSRSLETNRLGTAPELYAPPASLPSATRCRRPPCSQLVPGYSPVRPYGELQ